MTTSFVCLEMLKLSTLSENTTGFGLYSAQSPVWPINSEASSILYSQSNAVHPPRFAFKTAHLRTTEKNMNLGMTGKKRGEGEEREGEAESIF